MGIIFGLVLGMVFFALNPIIGIIYFVILYYATKK